MDTVISGHQMGQETFLDTEYICFYDQLINWITKLQLHLGHWKRKAQ